MVSQNSFQATMERLNDPSLVTLLPPAGTTFICDYFTESSMIAQGFYKGLQKVMPETLISADLPVGLNWWANKVSGEGNWEVISPIRYKQANSVLAKRL